MDSELEAMRVMAEALSSLDQAARARAIHWIASKYDVALAPPDSKLESEQPVAPNEVFRDFGDLFYRFAPENHAERALAAAYWLAGSSGDSFPGQAINALLKDLGYQIPNITDALSQNMREKPALIIQIRKGGSTKQARKQYKLTDAGYRRVRDIIERGRVAE